MAEKVDSSTPVNLTRSILTVLVPGIVAMSPWLLALVQHTSATLGFKEYQTLAHAGLFAAAIVVGTLCQGFGSFLERQWDKDLNKELEVNENWYAYLARPLDHE